MKSMHQRPAQPELSTETYRTDVGNHRLLLRDQLGHRHAIRLQSVQVVSRRLRPNSSVEYVGAGAGATPLALAALARCTVNAFEGSEAHSELLRENIAANPTVDVHEGQIRFRNDCCPGLGARTEVPTIEIAVDPPLVSCSHDTDSEPDLVWLHSAAIGDALLADPTWLSTHRNADLVLSDEARAACAHRVRSQGYIEEERLVDLSIYTRGAKTRRAATRERLTPLAKAIAQRVVAARGPAQRVAHEGVELGAGSYVNGELPRLVVVGERSPKPVIGRFSSIASGVTFVAGGGHRPEYVTTSPVVALFGGGRERSGHGTSRGPIVVGNDVWIGFGATIMSGVTIGDGAIVAARSVVTRPVPNFAIVAGSPAVIVSSRFSTEVARSLERIRWWEWDESVVASHRYVLESCDVEAFCAAHDPLWSGEA